MAKTRYKSPKCAFRVVGDHIETEAKMRHKVSGTSMAGILGVSPFNTPFQVACSLLGVCRADLDGKPSIETGKILEPVIIGYLGRVHPDKGSFLPADAVYEKREGDHDAWESDFPDDVFAGHVDGIVTSPEGVDRILEIKTSSNIDSWTSGVPEYYYWQVALYNEFITQQDSAVVGLGIVDDNTHRNPLSWVPNERNVVMFEMPIDREQVREGMRKVQDWYNEYIVKGITPPYNPNNSGDVEMFNYLVGISSSVEDVQRNVDRLGEVDFEINMLEAKSMALYNEREHLKETIKNYMEAHDLSSLDGVEMPYAVTLTASNRSSIDKTKMMEDGIDVEKYTKYTTANIFKIRMRND